MQLSSGFRLALAAAARTWSEQAKSFLYERGGKALIDYLNDLHWPAGTRAKAHPTGP